MEGNGSSPGMIPEIIRKERKNTMSKLTLAAASTMIPCLYTHYSNRATTLHLKAQELVADMHREGAAPEVLEAIQVAIAGVLQVRLAIESAKLTKETQLEQERSAKKATRDEELATKRAQRAATKAAKASASQVTVVSPSSDPEAAQEGPSGPASLRHRMWSAVPV